MSGGLVGGRREDAVLPRSSRGSTGRRAPPLGSGAASDSSQLDGHGHGASFARGSVRGGEVGDARACGRLAGSSLAGGAIGSGGGSTRPGSGEARPAGGAIADGEVGVRADERGGDRVSPAPQACSGRHELGAVGGGVSNGHRSGGVVVGFEAIVGSGRAMVPRAQ